MSSAPTVFLVEDNREVRRALQTLLSSAALPVEMYSSAEDFLARFDVNRPGCVVAEIRLPGVGGLELQQRLKKLGSSLPFIIIAGFASVSESVQAMKGGAFDFMRKPLNLPAFLEKVRAALEADRLGREESAARRSVEERLKLLTPREREVLRLLFEGKTSKEIARSLDISVRTVEGHRRALMQKMHASSVAKLILTVLRAPSL